VLLTALKKFHDYARKGGKGTIKIGKIPPKAEGLAAM